MNHVNSIYVRSTHREEEKKKLEVNDKLEQPKRKLLISFLNLCMKNRLLFA